MNLPSERSNMPNNSILKEDDLKDHRSMVLEDGFEKAEVRYCCLWCADTKYHLYVNKVKGLYHCFKCGAKGRYINSPASTISNLDELKTRFSSFTNTTNTLRRSISKEREIRSLPLNKAINYQDIAYQYLANRAVTMDEIEELDILQSRDGSEIIFPVGLYRETDVCRYYVRRALPPLVKDQPKYLNAPWDKGDTLYYVGRRLRIEEAPLIVCEGCFDALRIGKIYPVVGLLGKMATPSQLKAIRNMRFREIIVMLDPDAQTQALKLRMDLSCINAGMRIGQVNLKYGDPGSSPIHEIKEAVEDALILLRS